MQPVMLRNPGSGRRIPGQRRQPVSHVTAAPISLGLERIVHLLVGIFLELGEKAL